MIGFLRDTALSELSLGSSPLSPNVPLFTTILVGKGAALALGDPLFRDEWLTLHAGCPWGTVYQGVAFSDTWWSVYATAYEPVIVQCRTEDGLLCGLLFLARKIGSSEVVHVGAHQAEYHTWLAVPSVSDAVITGALRELESRRLTQRLRFHFLAPGSPVSWIADYEGSLSPQCLLGTHRRGLLRLDAGAGATDSLRKPANRSKLKRLSKNGELSLCVLKSSAELEPWLPRIIAMCDARQGAVHQSMPFRDDPRKAGFHLALADHPGLTHVALLIAGEELIAAHIGAIDGERVLLGLIAHSPQHGRHSPGKLLLLMLAQRLAADGYSAFDLTPGGTYKERFASEFDQVHSIDVRFIASEAMFLNARRRAAVLARLILPSRAASARSRTSESTSAGGLYLLERPLDHALLYDCRQALQTVDEQFTVRINHLDDLLLFGGPDTQRERLLEFLSEAVARLEDGYTMVTVSDTRALVHLTWSRGFPALPHLAPGAGDAGAAALLIEHGMKSELASESVQCGAIAASILAVSPEPSNGAFVLFRANRASVLRESALKLLGFRKLSAHQSSRWSEWLSSGYSHVVLSSQVR